MKLIDNRYKINRKAEDNIYCSIYEVMDFWNNKRLLMRLYNSNKQNKVIKYFIKNFINLARVKHKNLFSAEQFSIINNIDGKKVNIRQYYTTIEYSDGPSLCGIHKELDLDAKLYIILQVCSVLDFLHSLGITYKFLSPSNIFLLEDGSIKLTDLASIYENSVNADYTELTRDFIAPEVMLERGATVDMESDKYSLGMLIKYLLVKDFYGGAPYEYLEAYKMDHKQFEYIDGIIQALTAKKPVIYKTSIKEIIEGIKELFKLDYEHNLVDERGYLNFKTKIVGRDEEINTVLAIDSQLANNLSNKKAIVINGDTGVGKTRFLRELAHLLKMRGRTVYSTEITGDLREGLKPITSILRQTIKDAPNAVLEKYSSELARVLPELKSFTNIGDVEKIHSNKDLLRIYDRIANYLEELRARSPIYIIVDNIGLGSIEFLRLFDYIMDNIKRGSLVLIAAYNKKKIRDDPVKKRMFAKWDMQNETKAIGLYNLDLSGIGEYISCVLGMGHTPLELSAMMLKESSGNPGSMEYMLKGLYATGGLSLLPDGSWNIKTRKYLDIYFPTSMDEATKSQLSVIEDKYTDIMKIISIYNAPLPKAILFKMSGIDKEDLNSKLIELVAMGLLEEKVSDWGYSYNISNIQLKKLIYYQMPADERTAFHQNLVKLIEYNLGTDKYRNRILKEELIYHLMILGQVQKALGYIVNEAKEDPNKLSAQSILLWEEAYDIAKDTESEYKPEILESLGMIYYLKGENDKALNIYNELYDLSTEGKRSTYTVTANLGIGEVYLKNNLIDKALNKAKESIFISKSLDYLDGFIASSILFNKILLSRGIIDGLENKLDSLSGIALENSLHTRLGDIYYLMGALQSQYGKYDLAIQRYEESIKRFHLDNRFISTIMPMNSIANIYAQLGEHQKAMEYCHRALEIIDRYGVINSKLMILNNLGEVYICLCDFGNAQKHIEEARDIAIEINDTNSLFLANVNLGLIYLFTGNLEQAYNCYSELKQSYNNPNLTIEIISQYYNFLGEYYYTFGKWEESLKYSNQAIEYCKEHFMIGYLMSKSRMVYIDYYKDGNYNKDSICDIRSEFRDSNLIYHVSNCILQFGVICLLNKDFAYMAELLEEEKKLKKTYFVPGLEYLKDALLFSLNSTGQNDDNLIELKEKIKEHNLLYLGMLVNRLAGIKLVESKEYYKAVNYQLESLDLTYKLIKNVLPLDLQISFIKKHSIDGLKIELAETISVLFNKNISCTYADQLDTKESIEQYFDCSFIFNLIGDEQIIKITESHHLYEGIKGISGLDDLVAHMTKDSKRNLELVLRYLSRETFAQFGCILIFDEEGNNYIPIINLDTNEDCKLSENLLALANRYEDGILINENLGRQVVELHKELLPKDIKAIMCVPIRLADYSPYNVQNEKRGKANQFDQMSEGYIYLATGRIFNRFDNKRLILTNILSKILYMNIENYKLKILSNIDKLTGVYTRKYFSYEFNKILTDAKRQDEPLAIMMLDLDNFKHVNDTYGHRMGDKALNKIGSIILSSIRSTDIAARYGGEEFIIILKNVTEDIATEIGEKIRLNIQNMRVVNIENPLTVSIGISLFPNHSQFNEELIEKADQALYRAKKEGRNRVKVWDAYLTNTLNRMDKLAGILTGNAGEDQRNVLAILSMIELASKDKDVKEKVFSFLNKMLEVLEAKSIALIHIDANRKVTDTYARIRLNPHWVEADFINMSLVKKVISTKTGEFLIDWEGMDNNNLLINVPNWQSVIIVPLLYKDIIKGIVYITVPIKEMEFDYNDYNLAKVLCNIFSTVLN